MAYEYSSLVVGSVPPAGQDLRIGRMIVVTVKDKPPTRTRYGDDGGRLPTVPRDGDDDVNVPGWLCPTRFC
ncbi:hypothetical protein [Micromonospora sp. IBSANI012]|uniref:hypothetical protein n=1 Tax=Micromonospora sp. IBSANI012 TaxID=3457761 RepID=UPI0040587C6A